MASASNHIAFKLEPAALMELLQVRAKAAGAKTLSLYAKHLVTQSLDQDSELARLREQVETLSDTIADLREELRSSMKALLVASTSGRQVTPAQAEEWAKLHFPDAQSTE